MKAKKAKDAKNAAREADEAKRRERAGITVNLLRQNQAIDKLVQQIQGTMAECQTLSKTYGTQRELLARTAMMMRVMHSAAGMLVNNKLKLWMIDENALGEEEQK